jgi:hypothetical protein
MGKAEIAALESLLGGGKRRRRLGKKDSRFGPELTEVQQRKNARNIAKSQGKRRSGWEDPNEKLGRESAKQFEDENPGALANVFENKKVQTAADKAVVSNFLQTQLKKSKEAEFAKEGRKRARARAAKTLARDEAARINARGQIRKASLLRQKEAERRTKQVREDRKEQRAPLRPRSKRVTIRPDKPAILDKTARKDLIDIASAKGKATAKQKANQKALQQYARRKRVTTDRKSKVQDAKAKFTPRRLQNRPDRKFAGRPTKKSDSFEPPDLDVKPDAPELTPADMDDDVQITDVVTAADRDAAARAAAVTLDNEEDDQEPEPVVPEPTPTDMDDDVQITDVVTAAHRDAAARAAAVTLDDDADDQKPEPVIPKPVKSEVFDLTEEEDPGGIIASAMGSDDQSPVVNEPMRIPAGGDDHPMQADKPVNDLTSFLYHVPEPVNDLRSFLYHVS